LPVSYFNVVTRGRVSSAPANAKRAAAHPGRARLFLSAADVRVRFVDGFPNRALGSGLDLGFVFLGLFLLAIAALLPIGHDIPPIPIGDFGVDMAFLPGEERSPKKNGPAGAQIASNPLED
jgi:hypothetical protein